MEACGHGRPEQGEPTVKLYGKGCKNSGELCISDLIVLELSVYGLSVKATVFVQPASEIPCLLGTNVLFQLRVSVVRANGEVIGWNNPVNALPSVSQLCINC